ncbi:hypothetical protein [Salinibacter grassmerensis]|uniref:hypothetical protein n=1 Tax=Salinibacter grassmerensis TaxID=3040353 RepID=UPI0021E8B5F9|nr:hypothetical protein [Salinibacter grassmerensis]
MPSIHERLYSMTVDTEVNAVRFRWKAQPTGEEFRYGTNQLLEFVRSQAVPGLIADVRNVTAHHTSSMEWLVREGLPEAASAGIEHIAIVHGDDLIARTEMETLREQAQQAESYPSFFTTNRPKDAREWIHEQNQSTTSLFQLARYLPSLNLFSLP